MGFTERIRRSKLRNAKQIRCYLDSTIFYSAIVICRSCKADCSVSYCPSGALISETEIFVVVPLDSLDFQPLEDIIQLTVNEHNEVWRQKSRVLDGQSFRIRNIGDHASIYAIHALTPRTLYRYVPISVLVNSKVEFMIRNSGWVSVILVPQKKWSRLSSSIKA